MSGSQFSWVMDARSRNAQVFRHHKPVGVFMTRWIRSSRWLDGASKVLRSVPAESHLSPPPSFPNHVVYYSTVRQHCRNFGTLMLLPAGIYYSVWIRSVEHIETRHRDLTTRQNGLPTLCRIPIHPPLPKWFWMMLRERSWRLGELTALGGSSNPRVLYPAIAYKRRLLDRGPFASGCL